MVLRTRSEILASVKSTLNALSPQLRIDAAKGPFFYLAGQAVAQPLADASGDVERVALLSTLQFPTVATDQEALALARAFGLTLGEGGFARGIAYVITTRTPTGSDSFNIEQGDTFSTASTGGQVFEALENRSLTEANSTAFYNPATRRYEVPVLVQAVSAGEGANIAARTLTTITGGAAAFSGVTNLVAFSGGTEAQSVDALYERVQQRLLGLDNFSRGGLLSRVQNVDVNRVLAAALTYSTEYPHLFYRLPDTQAIDVWCYNIIQDTLTTDTFTATAGQTQFVLSQKPAIYLSSVFVNGAPATSSLVYDESLSYGRSTKESSYVSLAVPATAGDIVDITYGFDNVLNSIQAEIDGYLQADTGSLFATDVLVRYSQLTPVTITVTGTVLGTFDPTTVESEVATAIGNYSSNGLSSAPLLGGSRSPAELRDYIRSTVPGISGLNIPIFCRKTVTPLVENIDIPRNARITFEDAEDLVVSFT
jgi:uncharacterized phage protein gp47/JayE